MVTTVVYFQDTRGFIRGFGGRGPPDREGRGHPGGGKGGVRQIV